MFSISSIISAPFFGDLLRMLRTHGLSPRFLNIPNPRNIRYRFSDIGYPISTYKDSPTASTSARKKHSFLDPGGVVDFPAARPSRISLEAASNRTRPTKRNKIDRP